MFVSACQVRWGQTIQNMALSKRTDTSSRWRDAELKIQSLMNDQYESARVAITWFSEMIIYGVWGGRGGSLFTCL